MTLPHRVGSDTHDTASDGIRLMSSPFTRHNTGCWHAFFHASLPPVAFDARIHPFCRSIAQVRWIAVAHRLMLHFPPSFAHPAPPLLCSRTFPRPVAANPLHSWRGTIIFVILDLPSTRHMLDAQRASHTRRGFGLASPLEAQLPLSVRPIDLPPCGAAGFCLHFCPSGMVNFPVRMYVRTFIH